MASKVYFTKTITPEKCLEMFKILKKDLPGKIAIKIHSGEKGNTNFIGPEFWKPLIDSVGGTVVETNTAYKKARGTTDVHLKLLEEHGWSKHFKCDILDAEGDEAIPIKNGLILKENYVGTHMKNYDSTLVLIHFKGHFSGGFGGALKQLSIGFGSAGGKAIQHTGGKTHNPDETWKNNRCGNKEFKEAMADAAKTVVDYFKDNIAYVAVMKNISVDCDCNSNPQPPCMKDIGILSSLDPVALDNACYELILKSDDPGKEKVIERINEKMGAYILDCAEKLGLGKKQYELINVD